MSNSGFNSAVMDFVDTDNVRAERAGDVAPEKTIGFASLILGGTLHRSNETGVSELPSDGTNWGHRLDRLMCFLTWVSVSEKGLAKAPLVITGFGAAHAMAPHFLMIPTFIDESF
jgi:hypothetical protein